MKAPTLEARSLVKQFPQGELVLDHFSARLEGGRITVISGPNGIGKSVFAKGMAGLLPLDAGEMYLGNEVIDPHTYTRGQALKLGIDYMPQVLPRPEHMSGFEFLSLDPSGGGRWFSHRRILHAVEGLHERYGPLFEEELLGDAVHVLPEPDLQRLYFMRALLRGARLLILDEPLASLRVREVTRFWGALKALVRPGDVTVIVIAHPYQLRYVEGWKADVRAFHRSGLSSWRDRPPNLPPRPPEQGEHGYTFRLRVGDRQEEIPQGTVLSIEGPASFKFAKLADELVALSPDRISVVPSQNSARPMTGLVPEGGVTRALALDQTLAENAILGRWHSRRWTTPQGFVRPKAVEDHLAKLVAAMDIDPSSPETLAGHLSGGNRQRFLIARETADAQLFVAYNLFRGLDNDGIRLAVERLWARVRQGMTVILLANHLEVERELADRSFVFDEETGHLSVLP